MCLERNMFFNEEYPVGYVYLILSSIKCTIKNYTEEVYAAKSVNSLYLSHVKM